MDLTRKIVNSVSVSPSPAQPERLMGAESIGFAATMLFLLVLLYTLSLPLVMRLSREQVLCYVLHEGPLFTVVDVRAKSPFPGTGRGSAVITTIYGPLLWISGEIPAFRSAFRWYLRLWDLELNCFSSDYFDRKKEVLDLSK